MAKIEDIKREDQVVKIDLGDKVRELRYDMNAFGVLEKRFGTVDAAMESLSDGKVGNVKYLLWAGLIHDEILEFDEEGEPLKYGITPFQVGALLKSPAMMQSVIGSMTEAIMVSMPTDPNEQGELPAPPKPKAPRSKPAPKLVK